MTKPEGELADERGGIIAFRAPAELIASVEATAAAERNLPIRCRPPRRDSRPPAQGGIMSALQRLLQIDPQFLLRMIGQAVASRGRPPAAANPYAQPYTANRFMQQLSGPTMIGRELPPDQSPNAQNDLEAYLAEQRGRR